MGPALGAKLYDLQILRTGIEEGLHKLTQWWVLGRKTPAPTGFERTTLHLRVSEQYQLCTEYDLEEDLVVLNIYERPTCERLETNDFANSAERHSKSKDLSQKVLMDVCIGSEQQFLVHRLPVCSEHNEVACSLRLVSSMICASYIEPARCDGVLKVGLTSTKQQQR
ncbi:hypothetical protein [Mesorhizobium erdmanii]|uniref:hypothetical protein n=1 Tax=Mesorhizobium erdmanii TaxID=1777866 RepID=UPI0012DB0E63|nr:MULTISPECIES: hypothetical protein [Mesorhizobium]